MTGVFISREKAGETRSYTGQMGDNSHVLTEADCSIDAISQGIPKIAGNHRKLGRGKERFFLGVFRGNMAF